MIVLFVKILVIIFDIITLPVYLIIQRPWVKWSKINSVRARRINPDDPSSAWVSVVKGSKHFSDDCETITEVIQKTIEINGRNKQCLGQREIIDEEVVYSEGKPITKYVLSDYKWITYGQFEERVNYIGKGLFLNGVKSGDNVMLFAETSMEWFICAQSILKIGATVATIYSSFNDQGIIHGMNETEVTHVLTSHQLLPKLIRLKNKIPKMSTIIYFNVNNNTKEKTIEMLDQNSTLNLIALSDLEEMADLSPDDHRLTYRRPKGEDIAVLLYTSGTTGLPKGVKITHKNILNSLKGLRDSINQLMAMDTHRIYIAFLPLAHIFEFVMEHLYFINGYKVGYSSPFTLTDMGTAIREGDKGDATLLKPTSMTCVPLILDRIRKGIYDKINKKGIIFRKLLDFAVDYKTFWTQKGFDTLLINRFFCQKFRETIGGQIVSMNCGGASLSVDTQTMIKSCLNITIIQGFASSETTANGFLMDHFDETHGRVGAPALGAHVKLIDWEEGGYRVTDKPNPRGEIVIGSDSICVGYHKLDKETEEAFYTDPDGRRWFITGDIGEVFPNGTFKIIDRKKDLIKLKFGEYVALGKIESELKSNEFVDNICVFGDLFQSYLVSLIIPNESSLISLAKRLNVDYNSLTDLYENKTIVNYITNQIRDHGMNAGLNKYENPQKIKLCSEEWTSDNGLLTAAMKIKRKNIINKYQKQIDLMYEN